MFKNKFFLPLCFAFCSLGNLIFAQENISNQNQQFQNEVDNFIFLRMNLATYKTPNEAINKIETYCNELFSSSSFNSFSQEEQLVFQNFKTLEIFNYLQQIDGQEKNVKQLIDSQYDKTTAWISEQKNQNFGKWFYATSGDLLSCHLNFSSIDIIMKDGLKVKKYYENALALDENMSYALTNLGQWYYFAPKIGGGSKEKAFNCFEKALSVARNDAENYFAKIFLSQILFDEKKSQEESKKLLELADSLQPNGSFISQIRKINSAGLSLLRYYAKRMTMNDIEQILEKTK